MKNLGSNKRGTNDEEPYEIIYAELPDKFDWVFTDDNVMIINIKKKRGET